MDAETLNAALDLALEFGPNWLQPIQERLKKIVPSLSDAEADDYADQCRKLMELGWSLGENIWTGKMSSEAASTRLLTECPQLQIHNISHLLSQGQYYAAKNGIEASSDKPRKLASGFLRWFGRTK